MKLINLKIIALLVASYSIAMIALTPLSWILPLAESRLSAIGIQVSEPKGTIWAGQAVLKEKNIRQMNVQWDLNLLSLLLLKLPIDLQLSNAHASLSGQAMLSFGGLSLIEWSGYVDEKAFEQIYKRYRTDLSGRLQLNDVSASMTWGRELKEANGGATWSGGAAQIPVGRSQQNFDVPMMIGTISSDEELWKFIASSSGGEKFIEATLSREGEAVAAVKSALAKAMDIPIPDMGENIQKISLKVF